MPSEPFTPVADGRISWPRELTNAAKERLLLNLGGKVEPPDYPRLIVGPPAKAKPERRGAIDNLRGCSGCVYSMLDGSEGGDFANTDRDAAFSAWAGARRDVAELELARASATGEVEKARIARRLDKAHARLRQTAKRCKRLGFSPSVAIRPREEWEAPLLPQTRHHRRKTAENNFKREIQQERRLVSPSCRNCRNWEHDERLSGSQGTFGNCWVTSAVTKASTWCGDHNPR